MDVLQNKTFALNMDVNDYRNNPRKQQNFKNSYGTWTVDIGRYFTSLRVFSGRVTLDPAKNMLWEQIKMLVKFINQSHPQLNASTDAKFDPEQRISFTFGTYFNRTDYTHYSVEIEISVPKCSLPILPDAQNLNKHLEGMFEKGRYTDVIIKTKDEKEIPAHKFCLHRSDVFEAMLNSGMKEAQEKVIKITDFDHDVVYEIIRYLYCDKVPKIEKMAIDLLIAADKYNIQGLVIECVTFLLQNVNAENFAQILVIADQLNIECLKDEAIDYIIKNRKEIFPTQTWKDFKKEKMELAMEVIEKLSLAFA